MNIKEYQKANCPECNTQKWDIDTAQVRNHKFVTQEESGSVGGEYRVKVSIECEKGHEFLETLSFYPASHTNPKTNCQNEKTDIIKTKTEYLPNPGGFYKPGYGWLIIDLCAKCGARERYSCTIRGILTSYLT